MWSTIKKFGLTRFAFYVVGGLLVVALWGVWKYVIYSPSPAVLSSSPLPSPPLDTAQNESSASTPPPNAGGNPSSATKLPTEWQKMSVTVEGNTGALLTTLATALFGATGWLMFEVRKTSKKRHTWPGFLAALCAGGSLFFGAVSQGHLLWMLNSGDFDPYDKVYRDLNLAQFVFLFAGAGFLARLVLLDLSEED